MARQNYIRPVQKQETQLLRFQNETKHKIWKVLTIGLHGSETDSRDKLMRVVFFLLLSDAFSHPVIMNCS